MIFIILKILYLMLFLLFSLLYVIFYAIALSLANVPIENFKLAKLHLRVLFSLISYIIFDLFLVPFDDNLSGQDLRISKDKKKYLVIKSRKVAKYSVNSLSIIKTFIKQDSNPFDSIKNINNQSLFS